MNQSKIVELFCINKEKPQMQCNGKCHLAIQLDKVEEDDNLPFAPASVNYTLEINPILTCCLSEFKPFELKATDNAFYYLPSNLSDGYISILLPPPEA